MNVFCSYRLVVALSLIMVLSCSEEKHRPSSAQVATLKSRMVGVNRIIVNADADSVKKLNEQHQWGLTQLKTGLWVKLYSVGTGDTARVNDEVSISYRVKLLDGKLLYDSKKNGIKTFILGHGGVESGLEQGLRLMRQGDSACFVMPPHLAHGLIGDQNKIPRMAIIWYEVVLQGVQRPESY